MANIRANTLLIVTALVAAMSSAVRAGDRYFECATPGGEYKLVEDELKSRDDKVLKYKKLREITIRQKRGVCVGKDGSKYEWETHIYLIELAAKDADRDVNLMFLCDFAGDGLPANSPPCVNRTTLDKELRPAYRNRKK